MQSIATIINHSPMAPHTYLLTGCGDKARQSFIALEMANPRRKFDWDLGSSLERHSVIRTLKEAIMRRRNGIT